MNLHYVIDISHQNWTYFNLTYGKVEKSIQGEVWARLERDGYNTKQWLITSITLDIENMEAHVDLVEW